MRAITLVIICLYSSSLLMAQGNSADTASPGCIQKAKQLLDEALLIMQKHYYRKDSIEWTSLITSARASLHTSADCEVAYKTVQWCFQQMKEKHSFIMPPDKAAVYNGNVNSNISKQKAVSGVIKHELIEGAIGYIDIPWVATTDETICSRFADSIQQLIRSFDQGGVTRWIIDLRKNTGGNCWPMLAGLGPLLGNGIYGYFVSDTKQISFSYENGAIKQGRQIRCTVRDPYYLRSPRKSIVVLTGQNTSSAGEIVALSFKGMKDVYLYGEPTAGLTTANATYPLSDGSMLVLTVCKEADRTGKVIEGKIQPDEIVIPTSGKGQDNVLGSAVMFLQSQ